MIEVTKTPTMRYKPRGAWGALRLEKKIKRPAKKATDFVKGAKVNGDKPQF